MGILESAIFGPSSTFATAQSACEQKTHIYGTLHRKHVISRRLTYIGCEYFQVFVVPARWYGVLPSSQISLHE